MTLMRALEAALAGTRRLSGKGGQDGTARPGARRDEAGEITQGFNQLLDMVDQLSVKASTDALTGALNRHGFADVAAGELHRAQRYHRSLSLIVLDLDHFKAINDRHGHAVGDRVLREISRLVRDNLRAADIFCRWGGEEFVILTPEISAEDAGRLADKLGLRMREHRAKGVPHFTASFGVATYAPGDDVESLFTKADHALYQAKSSGRDRVVVYQPGGPASASAADKLRSRISLVSNSDSR
jgi:diguanylate cyclase (GGDEF)-like protein